MTIDPQLPRGSGGDGNGGDGNGGDGQGCQPGGAPGPSSIKIKPNLGSSDVVAVATGTDVQLTGNAVARVWRKDCSFVDRPCRSIVWTLYYTPPGGGATNATSLLLGGPQSNPNSFNAGVRGLFQAVLGCPELALHGFTVASANIYVGPSWELDSKDTTTIWIHNSLAGMRKEQNRAFRAVFVEAPQPQRVLVQVDPISVSTITVTQQSADGTFDSAIGLLSLHFVGKVSGQVNGFQVSGTINITLSTEGTITPLGEPSPISGKRRGGDGSVTLVGDAPIDGLPGTTHAWLQVPGTLIAL